MFWGIELVKDKETKQPIHPRKDVESLTKKLSDMGLIMSCNVGTVRFMPPLITSKGDIDDIIETATGDLGKEVL